VEQAEALTGIMAGDMLDCAVVIDVPLELARARLLARRVHGRDEQPPDHRPARGPGQHLGRPYVTFY
jgi:hypothetical protein